MVAANKNEVPEPQEVSTTAVHSVSSRPPKQAGPSYTLTLPTWRPRKIPTGDWRHWPSGLLAAAFILVALLGGVVGGYAENHGNSSGLLSSTLSGQKKIVTNQSQLISQIAKTVGPSVVSVNVSISASSSNSQNSFGLFGFAQPQAEQAAGTGIIIDSNGLIMTNRHVVPSGTTNVSVTLSDGTELKDVSVVGRSSNNSNLDVAFLKVNNAQGHHLSPAVIGDSSTVQVGDDVVAIGNALGQFQNTVTSGIISGYGRSVQASSGSSGSGSTNPFAPTTSSSTENLDNLLQTDAAINEGNSGGPLVNLNGQVIGLDTATAGNAQNIGFAIPINDLRGLINQVVKTGKLAVPYLGVHYIPLTSDVAKTFNLSVQNGAFIAPSSDPTQPSVIAGSPADKAGLQTNDIITQVNGTSLDQNHSLTSLLDQHQPGDSVNLTILRAGKSQQVSANLAPEPSG